MVQFKTEMGRIGQEVRRASTERARRLFQLRSETQHTLGQARVALEHMCSDRQRLAADLAHAGVQARKAAGRTQEGRCKAARERAVLNGRDKRGRAHFVTGLRHEVDGLLRASRQNLNAFAADFAGGAQLFRQTVGAQTAPEVRGAAKTGKTHAGSRGRTETGRR